LERQRNAKATLWEDKTLRINVGRGSERQTQFSASAEQAEATPEDEEEAEDEKKRARCSKALGEVTIQSFRTI
jgi:hypothetical protein